VNFIYVISIFKGIVPEIFRITPDNLARVRKLLQVFVGRKKQFHNFIDGAFAHPKDWIMGFLCSEPFVREELEYVILQVKGTHFKNNQIQKMIGLLTAILRGIVNENIVHRALRNEKLNIPGVPSVGLILNDVHYEK